jgi:hypothetical protein
MPIEVRLATVSSRNKVSSPGEASRSARKVQILTGELEAVIDANPRWIRPTHGTVRPGSLLISPRKCYLPRAQFCNI